MTPITNCHCQILSQLPESVFSYFPVSLLLSHFLIFSFSLSPFCVFIVGNTPNKKILSFFQSSFVIVTRPADSATKNGSNSPSPTAEDAEVARAMGNNTGNGGGNNGSQSATGDRNGIPQSDDEEVESTVTRGHSHSRKMNRTNSSASSVISGN